MLKPDDRKLLLELLQPPPGHEIEWAIGTTYSLDLVALLSAPVAFAFSDWQDQDGRPIADPLALLKAVREYADRVCLFCQAGQIGVPRAYQPLLTNLENSIVECNAPRGGSFHAKMWFLRFRDEDDSILYRVLCLSRNMTFDRCWDTMLTLEGPLRDRKKAYRRNHPLGEFVEGLRKCATRQISRLWRRRLGRLAHDLRRVDFEIPEPFYEMDFWTLGLSDEASWPFPDRMDRVLVVAPFVDDGFTADLEEYDCKPQLVSRPESLAGLEEASRHAYDKLWILDDAAEPEPGEAEETPELQNGQPDTEPQAVSDSPLMGLHAKLFVADIGWDASVWTGSANATTAGFERNVEFLVELRGKRSKCGVDAILGHTEEEGAKQPTSFSDLLQPYHHRDDGEAQPDEERAFQLEVDRLAKTMAASAPVASCEADEEDEEFQLSIRPTRTHKLALPAGYSLRARPISLPDARARPVQFDSEAWVRFTGVSLLGLTSFVAFQVTSEDLPYAERFVLNIPLENAPENRDEKILRHLLSDRDRVLRFLLLLLLDHDASEFVRLLNESGQAESNVSVIHRFFNCTLFESLMRALDRDPQRLEQVAQVIDDLKKSPEGRELLPADLSEIWEPIWEVRQRQLEAAAKKQRSK